MNDLPIVVLFVLFFIYLVCWDEFITCYLYVLFVNFAPLFTILVPGNQKFVIFGWLSMSNIITTLILFTYASVY